MRVMLLGFEQVRWLMAAAMGFSLASTVACAQSFYVSSLNQTVYNVSATGVVSPYVTLPGNGYEPMGLIFDHSGSLFVADWQISKVSKITNGVARDFATLPGGSDPVGLAFDDSGNLYTANSGLANISRITPDGAVSTFATLPLFYSEPWGLAYHGGILYVMDTNTGGLYKVTAGGSVSLYTTLTGDPCGMIFDSAGNLFVAEAYTNQVVKITPGGSQSVYATLPAGSYPESLTFDSDGNLYTADADTNQISKITPTGTVSTFASGINYPTFITFVPAPEPGTTFLLSAGVGLCCLRRRRASVPASGAAVQAALC